MALNAKQTTNVFKRRLSIISVYIETDLSGLKRSSVGHSLLKLSTTSKTSMSHGASWRWNGWDWFNFNCELSRLGDIVNSRDYYHLWHSQVTSNKLRIFHGTNYHGSASLTHPPSHVIRLQSPAGNRSRQSIKSRFLSDAHGVSKSSMLSK